MEELRKCRTCKAEKPTSEFHKGNSPEGLQYDCKPCNNARSSKWQRENRDKTRPIQRRSNMKRRYGITEQQYDEMLAAQDGVCYLCGKGPETQRWGRLALDHCHETGVVRKLLCHHCNAALGNFGDSVEMLEKAIDYLKSFKG